MDKIILNSFRVYYDGKLLSNAQFYKSGVWYVSGYFFGSDRSYCFKACKCIYYYIDSFGTNYKKSWDHVRDILLCKRRLYEISQKKKKSKTLEEKSKTLEEI